MRAHFVVGRRERSDRGRIRVPVHVSFVADPPPCLTRMLRDARFVLRPGPSVAPADAPDERADPVEFAEEMRARSLAEPHEVGEVAAWCDRVRPRRIEVFLSADPADVLPMWHTRRWTEGCRIADSGAVLVDEPAACRVVAVRGADGRLRPLALVRTFALPGGRRLRVPETPLPRWVARALRGLLDAGRPPGVACARPARRGGVRVHATHEGPELRDVAGVLRRAAEMLRRWRAARGRRL